MKKIVFVAAGALVLASAVAYAQMQYPRAREAPDQPHTQMSQMGPGHMGPGHMGPGHMGPRGMGPQGMGPGHQMGPGRQMGPGMMHGPNQGAHTTHADRPKGDTGPSSLAFHGINRKMHEGMDIAFTGDADADFVRGMIPHHQGAVDMAKVVLAFGKDPAIRKLAEDVVKAQESEIALMQNWLKARGQ